MFVLLKDMKLNISPWIRFCLHMVVIATTIKETIGKNGGCDSALGMESGNISDRQISASSFMLAPPSVARLNNKRRSLFSVWCASYNDFTPWLQIDLLVDMNITGVSSQGVKFTGDHWISSYTVSYSCDGRVWQPYKLGSTVKTFSGNNDTDSVVRNHIPKAIVARMIRIHPTTWHYWGSTCMRLEVHGCKSDQVCRPNSHPTTPTPSNPTTTVIPTTAQTKKPLTTERSTTVMSSTQTTRTTIKTKPPCTDALGMENYRIKDYQITASSARNAWTLPSAGRLNNRLKKSSLGSWCASSTDSNQYLQLDFQIHTTIVAIATQGMAFPDGNWVTSYTVSYSCDGNTWFVYEEKGRRKSFSGNSDSKHVVKHHLATPLTARLVRLKPVTWNKFGYICVRMELYGCNASEVCKKGNKSESVNPATSRTKELRATIPAVPDIMHDPVGHNKPTVHSNTPQPTTTHQTTPTKKRKRIVIIYKEIEDEDGKSCANRINLNIAMVLFYMLLRLLVFRYK